MNFVLTHPIRPCSVNTLFISHLRIMKEPFENDADRLYSVANELAHK